MEAPGWVVRVLSGCVWVWVGGLKQDTKERRPLHSLTPYLGFGFAGSISLLFVLPVASISLNPWTLAVSRSTPILGDEFLGTCSR